MLFNSEFYKMIIYAGDDFYYWSQKIKINVEISVFEAATEEYVVFINKPNYFGRLFFTIESCIMCQKI